MSEHHDLLHNVSLCVLCVISAPSAYHLQFCAPHPQSPGLAVRLPGPGPWARLAYRVDQTRLAGGRRETVEAMSLGVAMELR